MESSSVVKHQNVIDIQNMSETPDCISSLPESVLLYILSFLPTKYVVQTSILSRRWRYLWTCMPTLDFDADLFLSQESRNKFPVENMRFVDFVNKVLLLHDELHVRRFHLACLDYCDISEVNTWIKVSIKKNVQELYLDIASRYSIKLPYCLFTCKSLVSLKLKLSFTHLTLPTSICFTTLRTLHLDSVIFAENSPIQRLLSSCAVLENFIMAGCRWYDREVIDISSPTVRNFQICDGDASYHNIKISIPNLISFKFIDYFAEHYFLEDLSSLIDVFIHIKISGAYGSERYKGSFYHVSKLLRGVSNARSLTLSDSTLELLSNAPNLSKLLPTFHNLNKLILTLGRNKKHFLVVGCLLQSSPVLESLFIDIEPSPNYEYDLYKEEAGQVSKKLCLECVLDHLKEVKIRCFGGTEDELQFVKLLLRKASNMERVNIIVEGEDLEKITEISKKILMFRRNSARYIISLS